MREGTSSPLDLPPTSEAFLTGACAQGAQVKVFSPRTRRGENDLNSFAAGETKGRSPLGPPNPRYQSFLTRC